MAEILGTGSQRAGRTSRVTVSAQALAYSRWDVSWEVGDQDTTNFNSDVTLVGNTIGSNIYMASEGIFDISNFRWTLSGLWDAADNPIDLGEVPGLYPRDDLEDLLFYDSTQDNVFWEMPFARVRSAKNGAEVKAAVTFEAAGQNQGLVGIPSGSA